MSRVVNSIYNYKRQTITAPRPITVSDMINQLKLDPDLVNDSEFVDEMTSYIDAAITECEQITKRTIRESTFTASLDNFCSDYGEFEIRKSPVQSVEQIQYVLNGSTETLATTQYYVSFTKDFSILSPVDGANWPSTDVRRQAVTIDFTAGYPECEVPADLLLAIKRHVAFIWTHRGDCDAGGGSGLHNQGATSIPKPIINTYMLYRIIDVRIGF